MKVTQCAKWNATSVEKCSQCDERCTQRLNIYTGVFSKPENFSLCNNHFTQWLSGSLEIKTQFEQRQEERNKIAKQKLLR